MRGRIPCPVPGCYYEPWASRNAIESHLMYGHHELSGRERNQYLWATGVCIEGDDIEKAKADWERLIAEGSFVERKKAVMP